MKKEITVSFRGHNVSVFLDDRIVLDSSYLEDVVARAAYRAIEDWAGNVGYRLLSIAKEDDDEVTIKISKSSLQALKDSGIKIIK